MARCEQVTSFKKGVFISPSGVRCVWFHHKPGRLKGRLQFFEDEMAQEKCILPEAQVQALEKKEK